MRSSAVTTSEFDLSVLEQLTGAYDASVVEDPIYAFWEDQGWFRPTDPSLSPFQGEMPQAEGVPQDDAEPFTVIMPPPNVTGVLHLGHAVTLTIEDALIRWHRMLGEPTLWLPGLDHAGIATQSVVEQQLAREGMTRHDLGREAFEERVWDWVGVTRPRITAQARRMGASCDWERTAFTLDPTPRAAVRKTFVDLFKDGKIYRGARIINWDPQMLTALSDVEVEYEEEEGKLWHVRYPFVDERGNDLDDGVVIATTRPETIPADVAIAVHPDSERWQPHLGRRVRLPLRGFNRLIPLVADSAVDLEFGTGALKITPGHDQLDFEIGERHGLEPIRVVDWDGTMTAEAGLYAGMDRDEARTLVAQHLEEDGYLVETETHVHNVGHSQRSGVVVEPLVSNQWFVDTDDLAAEAARVVREGEVQIVPERSTSVYLQWMDNIRPWCISRQLWWGHRIPAWYCRCCDGDQIITGDDGQITIDEGARPIVEMTDPTECPWCDDADLVQDPDVLDTWFSSGLWTHSTLGWPETTDDLSRFYPSSVMETGYDILFFWVARMIMMGCYNMGEPPFHTVYLHGLVRDAQGRKMSKSLDNVIDPLEKADQYGMDALRFTLATGSTPGNDMRLTDERLEGSRNFANKLWNGAKFVLGEIANAEVSSPPAVRGEMPKAEGGSPLEDRWILSRLQAVTDSVDELLRQYQLGEAGRQIQDFLWDEFFDWYVEASKVRLRNGDASPLPVLTEVLDGGLRLLHPWMPFVTEAIWQQLRPHLGEAAGSTALIGARYPQTGDRPRDPEAEASFGAVQEIVTAVRQVRADYRVQAGQWAEAYVLPQDDVAQAVSASAPIVEVLSRARPLTIVSKRGEAPTEQIASAVLPAAEVILPLGGLVDLEQERARLSKDLEGIVKRLRGAEAKLANEGFRAKAPPDVVKQAEELAADLQRQQADLESRIGALG
ncbi:MAG: valine--tRNA ligase [Chloroflexi bacterium]|nr:valine--tRNA ligase [Chloroflexota bacterium]MYF80306.1 valine--tRNA ligase [Chloroflexota bacterium]MYI03507.1 valine--tRNA ligase [Chloroflexota bacterium]